MRTRPLAVLAPFALSASLLAATSLAATSLAIVGGCNKTQPKPKAPAPVAPPAAKNVAKAAPDAGAPAAADVAAKPPPSPVDDGKAAAAADLGSPKTIQKAVDTADALVAWADKHAADADAAAARAWSAELRLLATGSSAALLTGPTARALGGDGAQARQLRQALQAVTAVDKAVKSAKPGAKPDLKGLDLGRVGLAVRALLASNADIKDVTFDLEAARTLAKGTTPEGLALRAAWLERLERAVKALRTEAPDLRFITFSRIAGRLLCPACADAHHVTPDMVNRFLIAKKNKGGIICAGAVAGDTAPTTADGTIDRLAACAKDVGIPQGTERVAFWGANFLAIATLTFAHELADAPQPQGTPLSPAVAKRTAALKAALAAPLALPVPTIAEHLPESGDRPAGAKVPGVMTGLGFGGLTDRALPLAVWFVGPKDIRAGLWPVVSVGEAGLTSLTARASYPAGGLSVMSLEDLATAKPDKETGAVEALMSAAVGLTKAADALAPKLQPPPAKGDERGHTAELVVDALAPASAVEASLKALKARGYGNFRFAKTAAHGRTLALLTGTLGDALRDKLGVVYERPLMAVVARDHVDLWRPAKARKVDGKALAPKGDPKAKLPEEVSVGYVGHTVTRLRIPIPGGMGRGLDDATLKIVEAGLRYLQATTGAGPLLHVVAGKDALAADVLRVAHVFQERRGKSAIKDPTPYWPETECGGKGYMANRRLPEGCPVGVAVAFSDMTPPRVRVSSRVVKGDKPKPPAPPPAGFCDKRDIAANMRKRKAAFRFCYERELRLKRDLKGRVVVSFTIGLDGKLRGAPRVASSSLKDKAVHKCLLGNVSKLRFKPPQGGVCQVRWPFKFEPR